MRISLAPPAVSFNNENYARLQEIVLNEFISQICVFLFIVCFLHYYYLFSYIQQLKSEDYFETEILFRKFCAYFMLLYRSIILFSAIY